jgi:hypothetical protein
MRSSKNRSRSKGNRNRSVGNIVNRVFDSSGPEGKVRGTPQQIIDKYNQLARDAQLGNDRVAFENFQQHAEHYLRMLAEAQREQEARREQQQNSSSRIRSRVGVSRMAPAGSRTAAGPAASNPAGRRRGRGGDGPFGRRRSTRAAAFRGDRPAAPGKTGRQHDWSRRPGKRAQAAAAAATGPPQGARDGDGAETQR